MMNKQQVDYLVPALADYSQNVDRIETVEAKKGWERAEITTKDGYTLAGTYIKNPVSSKKAVLILHGLYQNRSMSIDYVPLYQRLGFNVLLVDLRGHGQSGGQMTWGKNEVGDIDEWIGYLRDRKANDQIGIHGVSLGGAYALLHSGANTPVKADFYVEDSAYDDLALVYREKLRMFLQMPQENFIISALWFYCQLSMYWHTGETMADLSPIKSVVKTQSPILFLHGGADALIPKTAMQSLYDAGSSYKEFHIFPNAAHAVSLNSDPREYYDVLHKFLKDINIVN
ncbi:alpha/beta hydrolase [Pectinatus haikarae]|uniref:Pimeloyl-ACP methyl ester carboxylesterase n=2 Tax=Pectinatus haikarae TaxID=349096 RepID=A0ABT9Y884_9FIRM|nr:alpha/beta fold hydrolase [Pectinatus haikarae]MDQ0204053.1 pimeloyl-ACP methyl ester carboxylesterase [Pectinatus haikarae]